MKRYLSFAEWRQGVDALSHFPIGGHGISAMFGREASAAVAPSGGYVLEIRGGYTTAVFRYPFPAPSLYSASVPFTSRVSAQRQWSCTGGDMEGRRRGFSPVLPKFIAELGQGLLCPRSRMM